jgi:hypothetical protein
VFDPRKIFHFIMSYANLGNRMKPWLSYNFRNGRGHAVHFLCYRVKLPNLKLKTRPKQLLGYLPLDIVLPNFVSQLPNILSGSSKAHKLH